MDLAGIIVAGIAFAGGYFSAQWQARHALAQWRRERLLEFCSDLLAAGNEIIDVAWDYAGGELYPTEETQRLQRAFASILLLSDELSDDARAYSDAVHDALAEVMKAIRDNANNRPEREATRKKAQGAGGRFTAKAQFLLLDKWPDNSRAATLGRTAGKAWLMVRNTRAASAVVGQVERVRTGRAKPTPPAGSGEPPATP
jgi:hypothetical protein